MDYNKEYYYNLSLDERGLAYNSYNITLVVNVYETINISDDIKYLAALVALFDSAKFSDFIFNTALFEEIEEFDIQDTEYKNLALFEISEKLGILDDLEELIVLLNINENVKYLDELKQLNAILSTEEDLGIEDRNSVDALIRVAEENGLTDAAELFALIKDFETVQMLDREPRKAISDFMIGHIDNFDTAQLWVSQFEMMFDEKNSNIQIMPQAESTYIEMPGVDGSIPEYTVYKNRFFNLIMYSIDGLTIFEKEQLKKEIVRILDATKNETKKLTFQASETSFDVKYSGLAEIKEGPSYIKAVVPFETAPYGYPLFDNIVTGSGLIVNNGIADVGCVNRISSGAVNPSFQLGQITYRWAGTVPAHSTLVIDHEAYMCYLENADGTKTNVLSQLTGEFQKIKKESSIAITASPSTEAFLETSIKEKVLW